MNDLKFAIRQMLRHPGFTIVAIVSLGFGIGFNSAVFSIINAVFLQGIQGVNQPERVVFANQRVSYPAYWALRKDSKTLSGLAVSVRTSVVISLGGEAYRRSAPIVSDNYFSTLGIRPILGRFFGDSSTETPLAIPEAVLDFDFWQRHFDGDPEALGQTLTINGGFYTIVGIAPESFHGPGPERPPFWLALGMLPQLEDKPSQWLDPNETRFQLVGRLHPEATFDQLRAEASVILDRMSDTNGDKPLVFSGGGRESWTGNSSPEKQTEFLLVTVVPLVATGVILWIACSNVANLLLARAVGRRREISIRIATGASRWRIVRLLLFESLTLAVLGGALGLLVSQWTIKIIFSILADFNSLAISTDHRVIIYTAGISLFSVLLFGLVPALQACRTDVSSGIRSQSAGSAVDRRGSQLRTFFLITQIACSMALLVITATFVRSLVVTHFGEDAKQMDHLLLAELPVSPSKPISGEGQRQVIEQLENLPGVLSVTLFAPHLDGEADLQLAGMKDRANGVPVNVKHIDASYFQTTGAILLRGSEFDSIAAATSPVEAIINERTAHRLWGDSDTLGRSFSLNSTTEFVVIGVVRDQSDHPQLYRSIPEEVLATTALILTQPSSDQLVVPVRRVLQPLGSAHFLPIVSTLRDAQMKGLREITQVSALVGGLALLLASTGLYGSITFTVSQRFRELGIRLALGATPGGIAKRQILDGLKLTAIGCAIGLLVVLGAFQFMNGLIFGKWTLDLIALFAVVAVFAFVTLAACWLPARRAAGVDPMDVLRADC